ncbi:MAG: phosphatidate cytidylyltransferase, partial [Pseudomonas formosensis]|nr:phosphatidate cytidylyltransferase [Halopseudomonas formosensis]
MLKQRFITGIILAPLVIAGFVLLDSLWFAVMVGAIVSLAAWEWARLAGITAQVGRIAYAGLVALLLIGLYLASWPPYLLWLSLLWWLLALVLVLQYPEGRAL